jgi:FixJ family two-component response regulator
MSPSGTVYVIDDDASVRRGMRRLLKAAGHDVVVLESAAAFLMLAEMRRPLCLVVDIRMPGLNGFDLQSNLRADDCKLPLVLMSGHGDAELANRAMASGALALLTKPVEEEELLNAVEAGLERDRERLRGSGRSTR